MVTSFRFRSALRITCLAKTATERVTDKFFHHSRKQCSLIAIQDLAFWVLKPHQPFLPPSASPLPANNQHSDTASGNDWPPDRCAGTSALLMRPWPSSLLLTPQAGLDAAAGRPRGGSHAGPGPGLGTALARPVTVRYCGVVQGSIFGPMLFSLLSRLGQQNWPAPPE